MGDFRGDFERIYKNYLVEYWSIVLFIYIIRLPPPLKNYKKYFIKSYKTMKFPAFSRIPVEHMCPLLFPVK
jgi:hypothetical protein